MLIAIKIAEDLTKRLRHRSQRAPFDALSSSILEGNRTISFLGSFLLVERFFLSE